jgi:hypothetical protein
MMNKKSLLGNSVKDSPKTPKIIDYREYIYKEATN